MKIKEFKGQDIKELSMIEVAHAILEQSGEDMLFTDLLKEVQNFLEKSDEEIQAVLSRFYTDLNTDGSFIPLGNNKWGLRSWFPIDSVDEETISLDYFDDDEKTEEEVDDTEVSVVVSDDSEDNFGKKSVEDIIYDENADDEHSETSAYDTELAEVEVGAEIPENEVDAIDEDLDDEDLDDDE